MNSKNISSYITPADGDFARIKKPDQNIMKLLTDVGFKYEETDNNCKIDVANHADEAPLMAQLRDLEVYFSDGKEWCPSEIFEHFRDKGLTHGKYTKISWVGPNAYRIFPNQ